MAEDIVRETFATDPGGPDERIGTTGSVVVALDGSTGDEPVLDWATDEAARLGAPLRVVSVVDPGVQLTPYEALVSGSPSLADGLEQGARQVLDRATARVRDRVPGLHVATAVPWGPPAAAIVRLSVGALRVVVGAPGRGRLERMLLGSVALPVVAHAGCPVAVVPADTDVVRPRRIVVAVDGSEASGRAVETSLSSARASGASVTCVLGWHLEVHRGVVVTEPGSDSWVEVEQRYAALVHEVVDPVAARYPGVDVTVDIRHGSPSKAVVEAGAELDADLVVVGRRGHGGFAGLLLGSVSRQVVQHAGRVVVVVPEAAD